MIITNKLTTTTTTTTRSTLSVIHSTETKTQVFFNYSTTVKENATLFITALHKHEFSGLLIIRKVQEAQACKGKENLALVYYRQKISEGMTD